MTTITHTHTHTHYSPWTIPSIGSTTGKIVEISGAADAREVVRVRLDCLEVDASM
jgi:hypothetical protein